MTLRDDLLGLPPDEYGESYREHCLEIYRIYVEMADHISTRRQTTNAFFLSINTALVLIASYFRELSGNDSSFLFRLIIAGAGMILCYYWYRLVRSYKDMNSGKFKVIHEIEALLPLKPYDAEWDVLGRGKDPKLYLPFTRTEMRVPWVFFGLHLVVVVSGLWPSVRTVWERVFS